jgi:quercetin dioxygenase-like cupin family protein
VNSQGWSFGFADEAEWVPWGSAGVARGRMLSAGDGYLTVEVDAPAGYRGDPHVHPAAEFVYVLAGRVRSQGVELGPGDSYTASAGSRHDEFEVLDDARYVITFSLGG